MHNRVENFLRNNFTGMKKQKMKYILTSILKVRERINGRNKNKHVEHGSNEGIRASQHQWQLRCKQLYHLVGSFDQKDDYAFHYK